MSVRYPCALPGRVGTEDESLLGYSAVLSCGVDPL
jgi:hypothetical protein